MLEPPYGEIASLLREGRVVPFLGAGVNFGHRDPREAKWSEKGSPLLRRRDIKDARELTVRLKASDPVSTWIRGKISGSTTELLTAYDGSSPPPEALLQALITDLNRLIREESVYHPERFAAVPLTERTRQRIDEPPQDEELWHLNRWLLEEAYPGCLEGWNQTACDFLPSGAELARFLARQSSFPSEDAHDLADLPKVASYFVQAVRRRRLRERLHEVFDYDYEPCSIHSYLAQVNRPLVIVTTNYDDLTERALTKAGRKYDVVIHPTDRKDWAQSVLWKPHDADEPEAVHPNSLDIDLDTTTVIYKMHGTVDREKQDQGCWVITEDDYLDFLARMTNNDQAAIPAVLMSHFRTCYFLFLGYGLRDWNLRLLLRKLASDPQIGMGARAVHPEDEEDLHSWAIQVNPSELEKELWDDQNVKIYDVDMDTFVRRLSQH